MTQALCALSFVAFLVTAAQADQTHELTSVRDNQPLATIVVAAEPTVAAAFAAEEVQDHMRKIIGTALPIMPDSVRARGVTRVGLAIVEKENHR